MENKIDVERMIESYKVAAVDILNYCDAHEKVMTDYINCVSSKGWEEWATAKRMYQTFADIYNMVWDERKDRNVLDYDLLEIVAGRI